MSSYSEFLKLLHEIPKNKSSTPASLTPKETYEQLCYDFPQLSVDELSSFRGELLKEVEGEKYSTYPISNKFVHGITYGASKYGSNGNTNNNNNTNNTTNNNLNTNTNNNTASPFYEQYSSISAIALVKFVRNALRKTTQEELDEMLAEYLVESEHEGGLFDDNDQIATNKEEPNLDHRVAAEPDGEDYVYESYTAPDPSVAPLSHIEAPEDIKGDWAHLSRKLAQLCAHATYDRLAHESVWTDMETFPDVVEIVRAIRSHSYLNMESAVPHLVFLLRDRMLDKPLLIRSMLPSCIDILDLKASTVQTTDAQMGVAIFASFASQKLPNSASDGFAELISQNLSFFEQRMAFMCELQPQELISLDCANELRGIAQTLKWYAQYATKKGNANVENVFIQNGIVRDMVALFIKFGLLEEMGDARQFLLFLCTQFYKISQFLQQVPPHVAQLTENEFQTRYPEEVLVWALAFHIHLLEVDPPVKWLDLAEKFTNEIFPNSESKGAWLQDALALHRIHTGLTLLLPFREVRSPPASAASAKTIFATDSFLGAKLRVFQKEVETLFKATVISNKDDTSKEGKRARKIQKKQHAALAKLQNLVKSLLEEQSKKD